MSINSVNPQRLVEKVAKDLEGVQAVKPAPWAPFVKTGVSKQRPPEQPNWWYIRAASMLRKVYMEQPIGTAKMRKLYSARKNRGHKPEHMFPASTNHIRKIFQQLEKAGFLKNEKGKGRSLTKQGKQFLDAAAKGLQN